MLTKDTTTYKMRGYGYCTVICFKGPYIKDVRTEGGGGFKNCSILRTNSTDRLREMRTRGRGV